MTACYTVRMTSLMKLRHWTREDAGLLVRLLDGDDDISSRLPVPQPYNLDDAHRFLDRATGTLGDLDAYAIEAPVFLSPDSISTTKREVVGQVSVKPLLTDPAIGEMGYWIGRQYRGKGFASAAVRLLAEDIYEDGIYERLQLNMDVNNVASQRVAEKAGFVREGLLRSWYNLRGKRRDFYMYSLLPEDLF